MAGESGDDQMNEEIAQVGVRYRFCVGEHETLDFIDVYHDGQGIRIRGGDRLLIYPDVSNVICVELERD